MEDKPLIFDNSDLNQSLLNKASSDKFQLIITVPEVLRDLNTNNTRNNKFVSVDSLQFSCIDATVPSQGIKKIDVGYAGQVMPVTSYARQAQTEVPIRFAVDNNYNNYHFIWNWLDGLNHCKESIPTKDYYTIKAQPGYDVRFGGTPDGDEPYKTTVKDSKYKHSFFDYQTTMRLIAMREFNEPIAEFIYTNAFVTELGELKYDSKSKEQLQCSFKFAFGQQYFRILDVNPQDPKER